MGLFDPIAPGPSAALEAELKKKYYSTRDPVQKEAVMNELRQVWSRAMKGPISGEDLEWAVLHRGQAERSLEQALREFSGRWARDGYLESNGGSYEGSGAPWEDLEKDARKPWEAFGTRVREAPAGEAEEDTLRAALAEFGAVTGQPAPESSEHWLAALRNVRAKSPKSKADVAALPVLTPAAKARGAQHALAVLIRDALRFYELSRPHGYKFPGPTAANEVTLKEKLIFCGDRAEREQLGFALWKLWTNAFRDPMPEEDAEWAAHFQKRMPDYVDRLRTGAGEWAIEGYLASTGGTFDGKPASRETMNAEAWYAFGERIFRGPPNEDEKEMIEAAIAVYESAAVQKAPPYSEHWVAAYRAIRAKLTW